MASGEQTTIGFLADRNHVPFNLADQTLDAGGLIYITERGLFGKGEADIASLVIGLAGRAAEQINTGKVDELIIEAIQRFDAVIPTLKTTAGEATKFGAEIFGLVGIFGADQSQVALHATAISMLGLFTRSEELSKLIRAKMSPLQRYANIVYVKQALRIKAFADILNGHYELVDDYLMGTVPRWKEMTTKKEVRQEAPEA